MTAFDEAYKKLNFAQRKAVDTIDGPVLVIAGPGTGKTQLLATRVANILRKTDTDPSNILCVTFTNKAANNMRERLQQLVGFEARKVIIRTFHSFAADIMNQYPDYFWQGARLSVAPDAVQEDIIQTILSELPTSNPLASIFAGSYTALSSVKEALKLAKEAGLQPHELRAVITDNLAYIDLIEPMLLDILHAPLRIKNLNQLYDAISNLPTQKTHNNLLLPLNTIIQSSLEQAMQADYDTGKTTQTSKWKRRWIQIINGKKGMFNERKRNQWWLQIADVYEKYRDSLHTRGYYDYSDMLIEVLEQLSKNPDMLADIQERYQYVLIDEFQDTNAAQLRLVHYVADHYAANNRPNVMAVGDDDQSIFAFNGAELNNMLHFKRSYPDTVTIVLNENYRSQQLILDYASRIITLAEDRLVIRDKTLTKNLQSKQTFRNKALVTHESYPTREHQQTAIAKRIKEMWQSGETDIAILARKHSSLKQLASILQHYDIPIRYEQQSNIFDHEAIQQICLIAQVVAGIANGDKANVNTSLSKLLRHPMWQLSPKTLWQLALSNYSEPDYLNSLLSSNSKNLQKIGNWLVWLSRNYHRDMLPLFLEYALGMSKGQYMLSPFKEYYLKHDFVTNQYLETLSAVQLLRQLTKEFATKSNASLADFVHFIELNLSTGRVIADETWFANNDNAVQLLTVHKAKGLEFNHVFLIDAIESMWSPSSGGRKSPANLRLQSYGEQDDDYVRLLYVAISRAKQTFIATSYRMDEKGEDLLATSLLSALPLTTITDPIDEPIEILENDIRWPVLNSKDERALLGDKLEQFALSPTALIDFLNVAEAGPASFKERHILKLPRPHSIAGSYGTAVHAALETAQRLINTSGLKEETVLDRFEAALRDEYLAPRDYDHLRIRGLELLPRLLAQANIILPKGAKSELNIKASLHNGAWIKGKIDSVYTSDSSVLISDYKTGKPLSNFDTKDKTKAIKAWRHKLQLLFYCVLLEESGLYKINDLAARMLYVEAESPRQLELRLQPQIAELKQVRQLIAVVYNHVQKLSFPDVTNYSKDMAGIRRFIKDLTKGNI